MNEFLKRDLALLLENHPELKECMVVFSESGFELLGAGDYVRITDATRDIPPCEIVECPDIITGHSPKIEVRKSPVHGYGVFAKETIDTDELIEQGKLLKLGLRSKYNFDSVLQDYVWGNRRCGCDECKKNGVNQYLALGFGSLYNYSKKPNTVLEMDFKKEMMTIKALDRVEKDEEIFIDYGKRYWLNRNIKKSIRENKAWQEFFKRKG